MHLGPGPVFAIELIAAARRWQTYALRCGVILALFAALTIVLLDHRPDMLTGVQANSISIGEYAQMGNAFATAVLGIQLILVLLAAPAATAGAVCVDKARGNLLLVLVTDLTSAEIILGKLFARLWPVLGLIATSLPVLFIASLFGGVSADWLIGGVIVLTGAAVLGCALALLISIYAGRTQDALLMTYFLLLMWLLSAWLFELFWLAVVSAVQGGLARLRGTLNTPRWLQVLNPFELLAAPLNPSFGVTDGDYVLYLACTFGSAAALTAVAIARLRRVVLLDANRVRRKRRLARPRNRATRLLARDPVRWYERFRRRPAGAARVVAWLFGMASALGVGVIAFQTYAVWNALWAGTWAPAVAMLLVAVGLLLVTVRAVTALADERVRGSLDILLVTPIPTREIVRAKWRAAFELVPLVLAMPAAVLLIRLLAGLTKRWIGPPNRWFGYDGSNWTALVLACAQPLCFAAMMVGLGLFLATYVKRFGRAVGIAVAAYVALAPGWMLLTRGEPPHEADTAPLIMLSPLSTVGIMTQRIDDNYHHRAGLAEHGAMMATGFYACLALFFYWITLLSFDRKMGRTSLPQAKAPRLDLPDPDAAILTASS